MNTKNLKRIAFATVAGIILGIAPGARAENLDRAGAGIGGGAGGGGSDIIINGGTVTTHGGGVGEVDEAMVKLIAQDEAAEAAAPKVDKSTTVNGQSLSNNVVISAASVGLGNVDNTRDLDKPVSTAVSNLLTSSYLPLAGGTMTGTIRSSFQPALANTVDDGYSRILGASAPNTGAYLDLYGKGNTSAPGGFDIRTRLSGGGGGPYLSGRSDGFLTWGGQSLYIGRNSSKNSFYGQDGTDGNGSVYYCGARGTGLGSYICLNGKYKSSYPGVFAIYAVSTNQSTQLAGYPNGTLSWGKGGSSDLNFRVLHATAANYSDFIFGKGTTYDAVFRFTNADNVTFGRKAKGASNWWDGPGFSASTNGTFAIVGTDDKGTNKNTLKINSTGLNFNGNKVMCHTEYLSGTGAITLATGMSTPSSFVTSVSGNWILVSGLIGTIAPGSSSGWVTIGTLKTARTVGVVATGCGMVYSGTAGFVAVPIQITTGKLLQYYWTSNLGTSNMSNMRINITAILSN